MKSAEMQKKFLPMGAPTINSNGVVIMDVMVEEESDASGELYKNAKVVVRNNPDGNILEMIHQWGIKGFIATCEEIGRFAKGNKIFQIRSVQQLLLST